MYWRFYKIKDNYFYDCFSNNIFHTTDDVSKKIQGDDFSINSLTTTEIDLMKVLINTTEPEIPELEPKTTTFISVCYSDKCNLKCSYCYRNMSSNLLELSKSDFEKIIDFVITKFAPDSNVYVFSLGLTSEPLLEINKIEEFQEILSRYEGNLFSDEDFINITPKELYQSFPEDLQRKFQVIDDDYIKCLNKIISAEKLTNIYEIKSEDLYSGFNSLIRNIDYLNPYRLAQINRKILEFKFHEKIRENNSKYFNISFLTNGTLLDEQKIKFLKGMNINQMTVSLDGDEEIHNSARKYSNGNGSYNDVICGIRNLQNAGINVSVSAVLTPEFPNFTRIMKHFRELGIKTVSFHILREERGYSFTKIELSVLLKDFSDFCNLMINEFENGDFSFLNMLRNSLIFTPIVNIVTKNRFTTRCNWGKELIINSKGDLFPCLYVQDLNEYSYGNLKDSPTRKQTFTPITVNERSTCKNCWAKYLCGGGCHYSAISSKGSPYETEEIECLFRKSIIQYSLQMMLTLKEKGLLKKMLQLLLL